NSLVAPTGEGLGAWLPVLLGAVGAAVLVATLLVFGLPRLNRRSGQDPGLFAGDDRRTADQLRRDARAAAAAGDWNGASEEMFRTITRDLDERTILTATPGTTAHSVALLAASAFPDEGARLAEGARVFDEVRYLGRAGTENGYRLLEELDRDLRDARPTSVAAASSVTAS
ncbi:MAG: hypothetical protein JWQ68_1677, partial [Cryobacterium sp.]|nr:hypothetical protein [Cryobacterium sp.]